MKLESNYFKKEKAFDRFKHVVFIPPLNRKIKWLLEHPNKISLIISSFLWMLLYTINNKDNKLEEILLDVSLNNLNALQKNEKTIEDILFTQETYFGLSPYTKIKAHQIHYEIKCLLKYVKNLNPKIVVEIGTAEGGSLYIWSRAFKKCSLIVSIDVPGRVNISKQKFFRRFNNKAHYIFLEGNSHSNKMINRLSKVLNGKKIDFLFIDGDHSYEGVKKDFNNYKNFISKNGVLCLHDIKSTKYGVYRFWDEIKREYNYKEFVDYYNKDKAGIGVIKI